MLYWRIEYVFHSEITSLPFRGMQFVLKNNDSDTEVIHCAMEAYIPHAH